MVKRRRVSSESEEEATATIEVPPASARSGSALVDSYTYHSHEGQNAEDDESRDVEWIMGIDEAGRGPVLGPSVSSVAVQLTNAGPMVYSVAYAPKSFSDNLGDLGFTDSKTLDHAKRVHLLEVLNSRPDELKWAVRVMSPHDISRHMLQRVPNNLNAQAHDATGMLIREVLNKGFRITECYVDTVGPSKQYQTKLESMFPGIAFTVESKADFTYPIVGAASIGAKVTRDAIMTHWTFLEPGLNERMKDDDGTINWGSGYPSDPKTVAWLDLNCDPFFGLPQIARFSWGTVRNLLEKRAVKMRWTDEPRTIQKYFDPEMAKKQAKGRPAVWRDLSLQSLDAF